MTETMSAHVARNDPRHPTFATSQRARLAASAAFGCVLAWAPHIAQAGSTYLTDFNTSPPLGPLPCEIHFSSPDTAYIEELGANNIGVYHPSTNTVTDYPVPGPGGAGGFALGADGGLWFGEMAENMVGRFDPTTHKIQLYQIPIPAPGALQAQLNHLQSLLGGLPVGAGLAIALSPGPDNAVWFVETGNNAIGRIDLATHVVTNYVIPTALAAPLIIHQGPGTTLVFDESGADKIGTIDAYTHKFAEYPIATPAAVPQGVTTGPDGNIWFSETAGQKLGKINVKTAVVTEYPIGQLSNQFLPRPGSIVFGQDGDLYVAEGNLDGSSNMGQFNPITFAYKDYVLPTPLGSVCDLNKEDLVGKNQLWFTEWVGIKAGYLTIGTIPAKFRYAPRNR